MLSRGRGVDGDPGRIFPTMHLTCRLREGRFDRRLDLVNGVLRLFVPWCFGHDASPGGRTCAWTARPHA